MTKGKSTWKYNKLLTGRRNYFLPGGALNSLQRGIADNFPGVAPEVAGVGGLYGKQPDLGNTSIDKGQGGNTGGIGLAASIGSIGMQAVSDIAGMINNIQSNDVKQRANGLITQIGARQAKAQTAGDTFDLLANDIANTADIQNVTAKQLGAKGAGQMFGEAFVAGNKGFAAGAGLGPLAGGISATASTGLNIIGNLIRNSQAKKQAERVNEVIAYTKDFNDRSLLNRAGNLSLDQMRGLETNYAAMGGKVNTGDFTNGLVSINSGGSHESNPYEGVPFGIDQEGTPNLVEEGETVFNDYVFSKRLKVPKAIRNKYKMRGEKEISFADMSKYLAKESEERPNDPISMRGLEAYMSDLASAQEGIKETQQVKQFALGGKLFDGGGDTNRGNQTVNFDNRTKGLYFGKSSELFNPYADDGTINWDIMYGPDSPYTQRRQFVLDHWDDPQVQEWLSRYAEGINNYNKGREGYLPITKNDITKDIFYNRTSDKHWGGFHAGVDYAGDPTRNIKILHMLRSTDGTSSMPESDIYYSGRNAQTGYTWDERFKDQYERLDNGKYTTEYDPKTNTETRTYFYAPLSKRQDRYYIKDGDSYKLVEDKDPYNYIKNLGKYSLADQKANDVKGTDFYYDPSKEDPKLKKLPTWMRHIPTVGLGIASITDAAGWTNKPDYSNADAILEATRGAGTYQPVKFKPVGNYLTYKPFDRNFYINSMNADANATRRALMTTAGGNRGTAMAGILSAGNNYQNQIGNLARQAEEYNFGLRSQVEGFNRDTDNINSQGFLQADMANQKALLEARDFSLKGTMSAAEMRERARLASEQAKGANISGFLNSIGDIGRENMAWNWRNFGLETDSFGHVGTDQYGWLGNTRTKKSKSNKASRGSRIKRKKELTI